MAAEPPRRSAGVGSLGDRAERALQLAAERAAGTVSTEDIASCWSAANKEPMPKIRMNGWRTLLRDGIRAGRVLYEGCQTAIRFAIAGGTGADPDFGSGRVWAPASVDRCRRIEEVLAAELAKGESAIAAAKLADACEKAGIRIPPGRPEWLRFLQPALDAGRIETLLKWGRRYFAIGAIAVPRPPRVPSARLLARCAELEVVISDLTSLLGRSVTCNEILAAWLGGGGTISQAQRQAFDWAIREGIAAGRVRVDRRPPDHIRYFSLVAAPPTQISFEQNDPEKAAAVIARAAAKAGSPVRIGVIVLALRLAGGISRSTPLSDLLGKTVQAGLACRIRSLRPGSHCVYYTSPDGPKRVRMEQRDQTDRVYAGVLALWRHTGGQPFTGAGLRQFVQDKPAFGISQEFGWTQRLFALERLGALMRVLEDPGGCCRWVVADAWRRLSATEQARRLSLDGGPSPYDFRNTGERVQRLLVDARQSAIDLEVGPERVAVREVRPIFHKELAEAAACSPLWTYAPKTFSRLVRQASSRRNGRSHIALVGHDGHRALYDLSPTPQAAAYVAYLQAAGEAADADARRDSGELKGLISDHARLPVLTAGILGARVRQLGTELRRRAGALQHAVGVASLFQEERDGARILIADLDSDARELDELWSSIGGQISTPDNPLEFEDAAIESNRARDQIAGLAGSQGTSVEAWAGVARLRLPDNQRPGRGAPGMVDRVAFLCAASARWGGPSLGQFCARGLLALGPLRSTAPFMSALQDATAQFAHRYAAAALGLLGSAEARARLVAYLQHALGDVATQDRRGLVVAAYGLGPLPFGRLATSLSEEERGALSAIAERSPDGLLASTASSSLAAWEEGWDRGRLLSR